MVDKKFHIEEEGIVIESFTDVPEFYDGTICYHKQQAHFAAEELPDACEIGSIMEDVQTDHSVCASPLYVTVDIDRLRRQGVPEYVISMILESEEELSSMRITRIGRIVLPEYRVEIKMPPLDKALYFLYLRHPEGIRFKELCDHREELMDLYSSITGRSELDLVRASIDALIDPMSNSVNEKCSRIKRAFTKAFSPELARNYYIDGKSGEPKSIALDRDLVSWETMRF